MPIKVTTAQVGTGNVKIKLGSSRVIISRDFQWWCPSCKNLHDGWNDMPIVCPRSIIRVTIENIRENPS